MASTYNNYDLCMVSDQEFCEEDDSSSKFFDYKVPNDRFFSPEPPVPETEMLQCPPNPCYQVPLPSPTVANQGLDHYQDFTESPRPDKMRNMFNQRSSVRTAKCMIIIDSTN